jgi:hypothetical protein
MASSSDDRLGVRVCNLLDIVSHELARVRGDLIKTHRSNIRTPVAPAPEPLMEPLAVIEPFNEHNDPSRCRRWPMSHLLEDSRAPM